MEDFNIEEPFDAEDTPESLLDHTDPIAEFEERAAQNLISQELVIRRRSFRVPAQNEPDRGGVPAYLIEAASIQFPDLPISPERFGGLEYRVFPLPGAGNYEVIQIVSIIPEEAIELQSRVQLAHQLFHMQQVEEIVPDEGEDA